MMTSAESSAIFVRDGAPMPFYIAPTNAERVALQPLIAAGGGQLLKSWRADAITLAPASAAVALTAGTVVYDVRFVTESVAQGKTLPLEDFRLRPLLPVADASAVIRTAYSAEEDEAIEVAVKELLKRGLSVTGNKLWLQLQNDCVVDRSWQSVKDRYLKILMPRITDAETVRLLKRDAPIVAAVIDRKRKDAPPAEPLLVEHEAESDADNKRARAKADSPEPAPIVDAADVRAFVSGDDDEDDGFELPDVDPRDTQYCNDIVAAMSKLYGQPRIVVLHALLACSGHVELAGALLAVGHERMRALMETQAQANAHKLRDDVYFSFDDDVGLRDGDAHVMQARTRESVRARWLFLEMPLDDAPALANKD